MAARFTQLHFCGVGGREDAIPSPRTAGAAVFMRCVRRGGDGTPAGWHCSATAPHRPLCVWFTRYFNTARPPLGYRGTGRGRPISASSLKNAILYIGSLPTPVPTKLAARGVEVCLAVTPPCRAAARSTKTLLQQRRWGRELHRPRRAFRRAARADA